jgi:hypothetical protein
MRQEIQLLDGKLKMILFKKKKKKTTKVIIPIGYPTASKLIKPT